MNEKTNKSSHTSSKTHKKSSKNTESRISDPCYSNNATTVPVPSTHKNSSSSHSSAASVSVNMPSLSTSSSHSHAVNMSSSSNGSSSHSHSSRSHKSSNSNKSRKFSNHQSSSVVNTNKKQSTFKSTVLFSIVVTLTVAAAFLSQSKSLSSLENLKSSLFSNNKNAQRYIRSVSSSNTIEEDSSLLTRVQNGVTEMYNQNFKNTLNSVFGSVFSEGSTHTASSHLASNGKLHYIPSSGYDPTKTAHHVLEGAGYRLNIPSYVQEVPASKDSTTGEEESSNTESSTDNTNISQEQQLNNEKFDQAITQKQVVMPKARSFSGVTTNSQPLTENGIVKQAVFNPNDVPISSVDPVLDGIVKEMLEKRERDLSTNKFEAVKKLNTTEIFSKNSEQGQCKPSNNVVFAKTHKTGGTTITNMLLRHAEKQKLNVALPVEYHWELAGYPAPFEEKLITPKQPNYDVMCHHMRFDKSKIEKMVNPLTDYFTILRDPVTNFESSFGFFKDYPFTDWLDDDRNIDDFINNAEQYYNKSTPWYFRAKNYMSFDLGFDHENNSDNYIRQAIAKMEEDFKFVMITDRYEESMILLKNMLCLDYDDIVYLPLKVRTDNDRKKISSEAAAKIKKWNRLDTAIYEYFAQRFEQMTVDYGKEKLANEVQILREKLKDVEARCVEDYDSQSLKPWIKRIKLRKPSGQKCQRLVWGEVKYADYLRQLQYSQLSEDEYNDQPKLDDKIELMQEVQKTILGDETNI